MAKHEAYGFKSDTVAYICSVWTIEAKCQNKWHSKLPLRCYFRCSAGISTIPILCNLLLRIHFRLLMILQTSNVYEAIVTRNGLIVWKCGPNWPFSAFMLRTKLYWNSLFFTEHQNVNKPTSRAARTVYEPIFLPFYKIIVSSSFFFKSRCLQNKIKLCYSMLQFVRETQTNTV